MPITADKTVAYALLDTLLERWTAVPKKYPYSRPDAVIPQNTLPADLRADKERLACFYFYVCIYMRGGIESQQAFNALVRLWREHPYCFVPHEVQWHTPEEMAGLLKKYVGWDSKNAGENWIENSRRLMAHWNGNPLNLIKNLDTYDEALRRMRNKLTKRDQKSAGENGRGFRGFQPKMVSMLVYFYDWEGWFGKKRFLYPAPADFHNFRLALTTGALRVPEGTKRLRGNEELSKPWRDVLMSYLKERKADPIQVADALWMFSLVLCGNSPLTVTRGIKRDEKDKSEPHPQLFEHHPEHDMGRRLRQEPRFRAALVDTCLRCPIAERCRLAIPSQPYYRKGLLLLYERPRVEQHFPRLNPDTPPRKAKRAAARAVLPTFLDPDG